MHHIMTLLKPTRRSASLILAFGALLSAGCQDEELREQICAPGEMRCVEGGGMEICSTSGTVWTNGSCAANEVCVPGECGDPLVCPDTCKEVICQPGDRLCGTDNVFVYECDDTGTKLQSCGSCAAEEINGVCSQGSCVSLCTTADKSYIGCEYYATDLDNANVPCSTDTFGNVQYCDAAASQFAVVLSNPDPQNSAFVSVSVGKSTAAPPSEQCVEPEPDPNLVAAEIIPPRGIKIFELPRRDINGTVKAQLAFRIRSNVPITAYQFNPLENVDVFSNDASLLMPVDAIGTDYIVMSRMQSFDQLKGFVTIVGTQDAPTTVRLQTTAKILGGDGIDPLEPGDVFIFELNQFEVMNLETNAIGADLTGTTINASAPVAVFAGSEAANAPNTNRCDMNSMLCEGDQKTSCECTPNDDPSCTPDSKCSALITCCADHLEQQIFPLATWGNEYAAVRSFPRGDEKDVWRILASDDDTQVMLEPNIVAVPTLQANAWFEFETDEDFYLTSTKPVLLGQFLAAQDAPIPGKQAGDAGIGDPAFILVAPSRQLRENYVFLAPNKYELDYVSIGFPVDGQVILNGTPIESVNGVQFAEIGQSGWRAARAPISDGFHELVCPDTCSVMVHGYDRYVSYGYPGGLNLFDDEAL